MRAYQPAAEVARALGGVRNGNGWLCRCPVPGHGKGRGDRSPSLSVADGHSRLLVRCFAGCDAKDVLAALSDRGISAETRTRTGPAAFVQKPANDNSEWAASLWRRSKSIAGSIAEKYLRNRGISIELPDCIRSTISSLPGGIEKPAMIVCVLRNAREVAAVQTTILTPDGRKADVDPVRRILGTLGDSAVRLANAGDELGLAEGVETALAAMQMTGVPCWATLGANRMHKVAIPDGVRVLHVFADAGEPGRLAAERTAAVQTSLGRHVAIRNPPASFGDFNDIVRDAA